MKSGQKLLETFESVGLFSNRSLFFSEPLYGKLYEDHDSICFNAVIFSDDLGEVWRGDLDLATPRLDNWDSQHAYSMEKVGKKKDQRSFTKSEVTGDKQALQEVANDSQKMLYILHPNKAKTFQSRTNIAYADVRQKAWKIIKPNPHIVIELSEGALDDHYISISSFTDFFPQEIIYITIDTAEPEDNEAAVESEAIQTIKLSYRDGVTIDTDIDGDEEIIRNRSGLKEFFKIHGLKPGDKIVIEKMATFEYNVYPMRLGKKLGEKITL